MQIWTASGREKKNHYAAVSILGILGITALAVGLCIVFSILLLLFDWSAWTGLLFCIAGTALAVCLAVRVGSRARKDSLLVCRVRNLEGREYRRRWFVARGYENEAELFWQLQCRGSGRSSLRF